MRTSAFGFMLVLACLVLWPADALAQSEIAGVVKDASGGGAARRHRRSVQPGADRKESAPPSPTATATTRIISLRPGIYTVTFTLPGSAPSFAKASS